MDDEDAKVTQMQTEHGDDVHNAVKVVVAELWEVACVGALELGDWRRGLRKRCSTAYSSNYLWVKR